jgi:hypothetical protein
MKCTKMSGHLTMNKFAFSKSKIVNKNLELMSSAGYTVHAACDCRKKYFQRKVNSNPVRIMSSWDHTNDYCG